MTEFISRVYTFQSDDGEAAGFFNDFITTDVFLLFTGVWIAEILIKFPTILLVTVPKKLSTVTVVLPKIVYSGGIVISIMLAADERLSILIVTVLS